MRRTVKIIVCLFIGAAMTVGVAWLIAWQGDRQPIEDVQLRWQTEAPKEWPYWTATAERHYVKALSQIGGHVTAEAERTHSRGVSRTMWALTVTNGHNSVSQRVIGLGFPLPALWMGEWALQSTQTFTIPAVMFAEGLVGGWMPNLMTVGTSVVPSDVRLRLPVMPLYFGFTINTLFYAAIAYSLWSLCTTAIAWRRLSRGKCPTCKYALGPSPICTECGTKIPGRALHMPVAVPPKPEGRHNR